MESSDTKSDTEILEPNHETGSNNSEPLKDTPTTSSKNNSLELVSTSDSEENDKKTSPIPSPSSSMSSTISIHLEDSDIKTDEKVNEGTDYTSETPPIQVMERERPKTPKNRIPSSVFARNQSGNQDWSMASNESLFSIQMSFNYQDSINWKSGDLDRYLEEVGPIPETGKTHGSESGIPEESIKPDLLENQERKSAVDAKSVEFPVLTGETDKGGSGTLEPISETEQHEQEKSKPDAPKSTWTNCFGCCTFCS